MDLDFMSFDFNLFIVFLFGNISFGRFLDENCFLKCGVCNCLLLFKGFLRIFFKVLKNLFVLLVLCVSILKVF